MEIYARMKSLLLSILFCCLSFGSALADGIVSQVVSAPIFANGTVRDIPSGINIYLQTDNVQGLDFMNPEVLGYGISPGGSLEIEMVSGFERDVNIPLDGKSLLLTVGAPQQGLPEKAGNHTILEGDNPYTFVIRPNSEEGMLPANLRSPAKGAAQDPIPQRGIKILHIGRHFAFVSRGEKGVVEVRFKDRSGNVIARGRGELEFLQEPRPQIFPTNITHDQRNHNWQRVGVGQVVGVSNGTIPMPFLMFDRNEGIGNDGIFGAGILSAGQLREMKFEVPEPLARFTGGLILKDRNGDGFLKPADDIIIGGIYNNSPKDAQGFQVVTPLVNEKPFLSKPTSDFNQRAGNAFGGSLMQVVAVAGDKPGLYRTTFSLLEKSGDVNSPDGSSVTYTVVVE